jgi:chromosome segregation ATPase
MKFVLLCAVLQLVAASDSASPVTKVVGLIKELKEKTIADGKAEQTIYDKYACWCETTSARKAKVIHEAHATIKSLASKILELKSLVTGLNNDIEHLSKQIQENQAAQDEATTIRTKENKAYLAEKTEMETTLTSLERAIKMLTGAGTKTALLQMDQTALNLKQIADGIHKVVDKMPQIDRLLTPKQLKLIKTFASDPAEFYDQKAEKAASYNPASSTILGIIKDMYESFSSSLEKSTESEAIGYKNYETLMGAKQNEMAAFVDQKTKKEGKKAAAEEEQAQTSAAYDETVKVSKEDTKFFDDTKAACTAKADEWAERCRARTEELAGIDKALEILTGDDAKALFNKAIKPGMETFLQIDSKGGAAPRSKAINALKTGAEKSKSLRLMAIASALKTGGHFDAVTGEIDKMMETIKDEEVADIRQKDWCKDEIHKNEQEAARYEYKVEKKDALIGRLRTKIDEMEQTLVKTIEEIQSTKKDIEQMEDERKAEHAEYEEAKKDDEGAVALLTSAIAALGSFYKNNPAEAELLQQPEFERSPDLAPDATFSKAGKSRGESKGILSIMTMLKEDLEDEITNAVKMEKENQFYFERSIREAHELLKELREKKSSLELNIADTNTEIDNHFEEREDINDLWTEEKDYIGSIKPDCDYLLETFADRRAKREAETQGLIDAKGMLTASDEANGEVPAAAPEVPAEAPVEAEAPAEAAPAFVQIDAHAPRMSFSGGSFLGSA